MSGAGHFSSPDIRRSKRKKKISEELLAKTRIPKGAGEHAIRRQKGSKNNQTTNITVRDYNHQSMVSSMNEGIDNHNEEEGYGATLPIPNIEIKDNGDNETQITIKISVKTASKLISAEIHSPQDTSIHAQLGIHSVRNAAENFYFKICANQQISTM